MCIVLIFTWTENYGDSSVNTFQSFKNAASAIKNGEFSSENTGITLGRKYRSEREQRIPFYRPKLEVTGVLTFSTTGSPSLCNRREHTSPNFVSISVTTKGADTYYDYLS